MISVTLQFNDLAAAAHALMRIHGPEQFATAVAPLPVEHQRAVDAGLATATSTAAGTVIAHNDRPDVGAPAASPAPLPDMAAAAAFGGAVVQAAPLVAPLAPAQPASIAPSAATGQTAAPGTVERDSTGLVWDNRIHASTKTKTKEGVWTAKRNVDAGFKAQVEADLRGVPVAQAQAVAAPVAPQAPAMPAAAPQAPAAAAGPKTFPEYMAEIGAAFSNRPVDAHTHMAAALGQHGLQHVGQLAGRPDLIPAVDAEFRRLLG